MMRKLLFGLAILPSLMSIASAGQPLSDKQMDAVVAGSFVVGGNNCPCPVINIGSIQTGPIPAPTFTTVYDAAFAESLLVPKNGFVFNSPF